MSGGMSDGRHDDPLIADKVGDVVGKSRKIHASETASSLAPEKWLAHDGRTCAFDFQS
jgi:hypothetical protein